MKDIMINGDIAHVLFWVRTPKVIILKLGIANNYSDLPNPKTGTRGGSLETSNLELGMFIYVP